MTRINAVLHLVTIKQMQYKEITKNKFLGPLYETDLVNKLGRLLQGICDIKGTITCFFVDLVETPKAHKIIYVKLVCNVIRTQRGERNIQADSWR